MSEAGPGPAESWPGASAVAGWYPDPGGSGLLRYWDGARWTEQVMPPPAGLMPPPTAPAYLQPAAPAPAYWSGYQVRTNGMAIASLVVSLAGLITYGIGFVLGVIFGHVALSQIKAAAGSQGGRGMAIAGLVIGYVGIGLAVLIVLAAIAAAPSTRY